MVDGRQASGSVRIVLVVLYSQAELLDGVGFLGVHVHRDLAPKIRCNHYDKRIDTCHKAHVRTTTTTDHHNHHHNQHTGSDRFVTILVCRCDCMAESSWQSRDRCCSATKAATDCAGGGDTSSSRSLRPWQRVTHHSSGKEHTASGAPRGQTTATRAGGTHEEKYTRATATEASSSPGVLHSSTMRKTGLPAWQSRRGLRHGSSDAESNRSRTSCPWWRSSMASVPHMVGPVGGRPGDHRRVVILFWAEQVIEVPKITLQDPRVADGCTVGGSAASVSAVLRSQCSCAADGGRNWWKCQSSSPSLSSSSFSSRPLTFQFRVG